MSFAIGKIWATAILLVVTGLSGLAATDVFSQEKPLFEQKPLCQKPTFCPLSRLGLEKPIDMRVRRGRDTCLFRSKDRRLLTEITEIPNERYEAILKAGKNNTLPDGATVVSDDIVSVDGRSVFLRQVTVPGTPQPRLRVMAVTKIDGKTIETIVIAQAVKLFSVLPSQLREIALSAQVRPALTSDTYQAELPVAIDDLAGFRIATATARVITLVPGPDAPTDAAAGTSFRIILSDQRFLVPVTLGTVPEQQALAAELDMADDKNVETESLTERDGLTWYELQAIGKTRKTADKVLAMTSIRLEPNRWVIAFQAVMPLAQRALFEDRFKTLRDNVSWK